MPRPDPEPIRLPDHVWHAPSTLAACRARDANALLKLARKYGGVTNERLCYWTGIDRGEISKRLNGKHHGEIRTLDRWHDIADALDMPDHARILIGLAPRSTDRIDAIAASSVAGLVGPEDSAGLLEQGCAEWLAWQLWTSGRHELPATELPAPLRRYLDVEHRPSAVRRSSPGGLIIGSANGTVAFARPDDVDLFVAQRVFRDIAGGSSRLLGAGQTSHRTDLVVQQYVARHDASTRMLRRWSQQSDDALVRVNSGGILAKLGRDDLVDEVAVSLTAHRGARTLYVTAVLHRVLGRDWSDAEVLARGLDDRDAVSAALSADDAGRMAAELTNTGDGIARWCSALVIGAVRRPPDSVRSALQHALTTERSRENLRAIGTALGAG